MCLGTVCTDINPIQPEIAHSIPEISMIGKTEEQLTAEKIPYEVRAPCMC